MREDQRVLKQTWAKAAAYRGSVSRASLRQLCRSRSSGRRLLALMVMRREMDRRGPISGYSQIASRLVSDRNNACRWQALIVIGEFVKTRPEVVWRIVATYGSSLDADLRMGIACVLLEHLLDHHFRSYLPVVRERVLAGDRDFANTLSSCWLSSPERRKKLDRLLAMMPPRARRHGGSLANKAVNLTGRPVSLRPALAG